MTYPKDFGLSDQLGHGRTRDDWADESWAMGALLGLFFLSIIGVHVFGNAERPMLAAAPADETTGQGSRPALPSLPQ